MHNERITAVRQKLKAWQVDALYVTHPIHRRWLSGFTGSAGILLVTQDEAIIATDFRYYDQVQAQAPTFTLFRSQRKPNETAVLLDKAGVQTVGFESSHLTYSDYMKLPHNEAYTWKPLAETLEPMRRQKTDAELDTIRRAAAITDRAMAAFPQLARPGLTEKALAWELEKQMRADGADGMAFPIIVASGPNAAHPHHRAGERQLQEGDVIVVDMGAAVDGYMSDMTRTFHLGNTPSDTFWEIYNLTLKAQETALAEMRPGMTGAEMDSLARDVIADGGHGAHFGHSLGHGLGLEVHEAPWLSQRYPNLVVEAGEVATIEPGIYVSDWGGVRIEDLVLLTEDGPERLSHCPKTPVIPV